MRLSYTLTDARPVQLGMIVLQSDETLEADMRRLLPPQVELLVSRVQSGETLSHEMIAGMEHRLTAAADLLPRGTVFGAVGYGCTSASAQIGSARVAELVRAGVSTPHVTDPAAALIAACGAMGLRSLGLVSPYIPSISDRLRGVIENAGIAVAQFGSFSEPVEANVVRITEASLRCAAERVAEGSDGVFLSCTNLRTLDVIPQIEARIGKPVLSSNQVLAWHMLRLAGIEPRSDAPGSLWGCAGSPEKSGPGA